MIKNTVIMLLCCMLYAQEEYFVTIPATSYSDWVYYSFSTHSVVSVDYPENSLEWDLAFQRKHIKTNSGLSGSGNGGAIVDSVGTLDSGAYTWIDYWTELNEVPDYGSGVNWLEDGTHNDFYDLTTHTFVEGIKNPALNSWGWFDETYVLNPTNYVMFVKAANGQDIVKFWAYNYYADGSGGNVSIRYQTGIGGSNSSQCSGIAGDSNDDGIINVVDVVSTVNFILSDQPPSDDICLFDYNEDGIVNVVDVVGLVGFILGE